MILVSPAEPNAFFDLGKVSASPEKYGVDFMWTVKGVGRWGVQRKEVKDLLASTDDGRLAKETLQMTSLHQAVLVVEGKMSFTTDGELVTRGAQPTRNRWTRRTLRGLYTSLQQQGWWVLFSQSTVDTAHCIVDLHAWSKKDKHSSLLTRPKAKGVWGTKATDKDYGLWVLQSAPGVGPEMARAIWDHFGGLPITPTCTIDELMEVPGVGKKRAEQIYRAFGGET